MANTTKPLNPSTLHTDHIGAVCQPRPNGSLECGDSAAWTGALCFLSPAYRLYYRFTEHFEVAPGAYVRHPLPARTDNGFGAYYNGPWDGCISRDQLTGILLALLAQKEHSAALRLLLHHLKWLLLFSYNTRTNGKDPSTSPWKWPDFTGPDIWALEIRALGPWVALPLWPLLNLLDIHTLLNTALQNFKTDDDVISFTGKYLASIHYYPTITSVLAYIICDEYNLITRLKTYWCGWRNNPSMYEHYKAYLTGATNKEDTYERT